MSFNPDLSKQAQKSTHPTLSFNNNTITQSVTQKHLGMSLDNKLDFQGHVKSILNKVIKIIGLLCKLHNTLPRSILLSIYKSFIRPHLASFHQKLELIQYNSALAITGATGRTSLEKLYNELGLETLEKKKMVQETMLLL